MTFDKKIASVLGVMTAVSVLAGCGAAQRSEMPLDEIQENQKGFTTGASVHDPSILKADGTYFIFGSHMDAAKSDDLVKWSMFASGVDEDNKLFDNLFDEPMEAFSFVGKNEAGGYSVWAPDVVYNKKMQKYMMYFCTTSTYKKSTLCFATADKPEGPYTFQDVLIHSGFTNQDFDTTNMLTINPESKMTDYLKAGDYDNLRWPNCIDPTVFYDKEGKMWMTYGSWSGGIFILEIDEETGYPIYPEANEEAGIDTYYGKHLLGGGHNSVEGPYILYDEESGCYYLFVSYGALQAKGGYQIRVFRSENPDGPYVDTAGQEMGMVVDHSGYGLKMMGNYTFPSLSFEYMAPGHNSAFTDDDGKSYIVYHQRFKNGTEAHEPRVHQIFFNKEGWPVAAPFNTSGETLNKDGYKEKEVLGTYYYVNHGTDINSKVHKYEALVFEEGGVIKDESGKEAGSFSLEKGTPYVSITLGGQTYEGIMIEMKEEAGNQVMCFTAAGSNNETIWGAHYMKEDK